MVALMPLDYCEHHLRKIRLDCGHAFFDYIKTVLRQFSFKGLEINNSTGSSGDLYGFSRGFMDSFIEVECCADIGLPLIGTVAHSTD